MEVIAGLFSTFGVFLIFLLVVLSSAIKIVQEYERGVIFRLGRLQGAKGPGLFLIIPRRPGKHPAAHQYRLADILDRYALRIPLACQQLVSR